MRQLPRRGSILILITKAARKHGISDDQIDFVIRHSGLIFDEAAPGDTALADRLLFLGDDSSGVAIEVMAVLEQRGNALMVLHAMGLRRKYREQYEEALAWRIP